MPMASAASTCDIVWRSSTEECHLSHSTTCFGSYSNAYMCYDYVHLDNLSDISAYRTVVKP